MVRLLLKISYHMFLFITFLLKKSFSNGWSRQFPIFWKFKCARAELLQNTSCATLPRNPQTTVHYLIPPQWCFIFLLSRLSPWASQMWSKCYAMIYMPSHWTHNFFTEVHIALEHSFEFHVCLVVKKNHGPRGSLLLIPNPLLFPFSENHSLVL